MTIGYEARIVPELQAMIHPLKDAKPHPDNVRKHRLEKIAQSLQTHGQRAPIIVQRSSGYIVKGNGTWAAAKMLGWEHIAMSFQEMDDGMAMGFLFADNRASDLASYDRKKLRDGLASMVEGPGLLDTLWEVEEFEDLDEEFRGIATLPEAEGPEPDPLVAQADEVPAPPLDPRKRMREIPMVFTAEHHALFTGWLAVLMKAFGMSKAQDTIYEAVKRQAALEAGAGAVTGPARKPDAPAEGQTSIAEALGEPADDFAF